MSLLHRGLTTAIHFCTALLLAISSVLPLLCIIHWLPDVARRIDYMLLVFTYKFVHSDALKYLCDLVCPYTSTRALRSAINNMLTVQRTRVKAGDTSFAIAATLWNTVPSNIKMSDILKTNLYRLFLVQHDSSCINAVLLFIN